MTIEDILIQEIESSPESLLEETLDFLRFLKTKQESAKQDPEHPPLTAETTDYDTQQLRESNTTDSP